MPRYIKEATATGGPSTPVVGSEESQIIGEGTGLYDVPGVWSPIYVCEGWDTPFEGPLEFCFNPSEYDELKVVLRGFSDLQNSCFTNLIVTPINNLIESSLGTCYCICDVFNITCICAGTCDGNYSRGTMDMGYFTSKIPAYTQICIYKGSYIDFGNLGNCSPTPNFVRPVLEGNGQGCNDSYSKTIGHINSYCCFYGLYWPSEPGDYTSDENAFTKINICLGSRNCFYPGATACCCCVEGNTADSVIAFYGKKRYTTYPSDRDI